MSKKRVNKKRRTAPRNVKHKPETAPVDFRALEKVIAEINRLVVSQDFETGEEIEAFVHNLMESGNLDELASCVAAASTPLEQAQNVMYEAWGAEGPERIALACQALALSPDCADVYVLLAEEVARDLEEAIALYQQGVQAGERALGPETFAEDAGEFWGLLETRPYMRARIGLAECLWADGRQEEAIGHYVEILRLNPNDNQGVRYALASSLLETGDHVALGELLERYAEDVSANWAYTRALYWFRRGDSEHAEAALQQALEANPFVPPYLVGRKRIPASPPMHFGLGDENEAVAYAMEETAAWQKSPGALDWLREVGTQKPFSAK